MIAGNASAVLRTPTCIKMIAPSRSCSFRRRSNRSGEIFLTTVTNRREAKHQKLRMPWLPMMEIDAEPSDVLAAHVAPCVHQLKEFFGFVTIKKLRIQKLGHPIHLMSVGEIEGDLDVFVGILNHDDAVVCKRLQLFHSPSKKIAQRGCTSVARNSWTALKNETALANVRGVVAELADLAAGAPEAMKPPVSRHRQTRLMALSDFIFRYGSFSRAPYLSMIVVVAACRPVYPLWRRLILPGSPL